MTIAQIIALTVICGAFAVFAVVLAWGDYRTRDIRRDRTQGTTTSPQGASGLRVVETKTAPASPAPSPEKKSAATVPAL